MLVLSDYLFLYHQQQRQQQQQQQKDQHPDLHLAMNDPTVDQSVHPHVLSPHSLPVANHSVAHGGAAEAIWGPEPESPKGRLWMASRSIKGWSTEHRCQMFCACATSVLATQKKDREITDLFILD